MKTTENKIIINKSTLNAIKQMLFSEEGGVNVSPIVDDLCAGLDKNSDLVAINVALSLKGIVPEIDKTTRYGEGNPWSRLYERYEFVGYSLILDRVKAKPIMVQRDKDRDNWEESERLTRTFTLEEWESLSTDPEEAIKTINEKNPIKKAVDESASIG